MIDPFAEDPAPSEADYILSVFGPDGYLAKHFSGYRIRPTQIDMTRAVDDAITFSDVFVGEAGTGSGKTFINLVPATYLVSKSEHKVVVVTANIALQEQIFKKDLPLLSRILPFPFTFGLLKGKNNFLCIDRYLENENKGYREFSGREDDREQLRSVRQWAAEILHNPSAQGDVSELEFVPSLNVWREFSVSGDECKGKDCKQYDRCFAVAAQREARSSSIIVTNYAMLATHIKLKSETGQNLVLPEHRMLIGDEAHALPDAVRDHLGQRITAEAFRRASNGLRGSIHASLVERNAFAVFDAIKDYRLSKQYKTRLKEQLCKFPSIDEKFKALQQTTRLLHAEYVEVIIEKKKDIYKIESQYGDDDPNVKEMRAQLQQLDKRDHRLMELLAELEAALTLSNKDEQVYFIEIEGKHEYAVIKSKPISVAETLHKTLWRDTPTVVLTSATISTGGNFDFIARELGLTSYSSLIAESPFDWPNQALLVLPDTMPAPDDWENRDAFQQAVADHFERIIDAANGRTLGLFTSWRVLEAVHERIKDHPRYTILRQGQGGSRTKLVERFKADTHSVLLGTESFWAGVDVPGEALSCVVIDRLPFVSPDDPLADAVKEADPKGFFYNYSIPRAIIALKQGFGRLIRSTSDVGCVVVLDNRLRTKPYGKLFLRSLPPARQTSRIEDISTFLAEAPRRLRKDMPQLPAPRQKQVQPANKPAPATPAEDLSEDEFFKRAFG